MTPLNGSSILSDLEEASDILDRNTLREHIRRIEQAVDDDPGQAVGSAKELLETAAKAVLEAYGEDPGAFDTLPKLAKQAMKLLNLTIERIPESARAAESMKQVFSGMNQIVSGIAELRNLYGTGHGRTRRGGLEPRHARFVAGASATLAGRPAPFNLASLGCRLKPLPAGRESPRRTRAYRVSTSPSLGTEPPVPHRIAPNRPRRACGRWSPS
jgi:hypothetical protein